MIEINWSEIKAFLDEMKLIPRVRELKSRAVEQAKTSKPENPRTLFLLSGIIGDSITALPALHTYLEATGEIADIIVAPNLVNLISHFKDIDKVYSAKSSYIGEYERKGKPVEIPDIYTQMYLLRGGREEIDLVSGLRNFTSIMDSGDIFPKYVQHFLFSSLVLNKLPRQNRHEWYKVFGIEIPEQEVTGEDFFEFSEQEHDAVLLHPAMTGLEKKVLINTGSGWRRKLWDNDKWAALLRRINRGGNYRFVFIGGTKFEEESLDCIRSRLNFPIHSLLNADIKDVYLTMKKADYFIGIDSGPKNLAHIAELPTLTLEGEVIHNFRTWYDKDVIVPGKDTHRVCQIAGFGKNVMDSISVDDAYKGFKKLERNYSE